jgi:hypothetical protein
MRRTFTTLIGLALLLSACGAGEAGSGTTTPGGSTPDTTLPPLEEPETEPRVVLTISDEGGFVPVEWNFKRIPRYVVMSDGTVYLQGPTTLEYPGAALPNVQAVRISEEDLAEILALIETSGLADVTDERNDDAMMVVADVTDTVFVFTDEDGVDHRFAVYALGFEGVEVTDERLAGLEDLLARVDQAVAEGDPVEGFVADRVDVFAGSREIPVEDGFANTQDWPLAVSFDDMADAGAGFRCANLEGDEAAAILERFSEANDATTFETEGGDVYTVIVRPLLPGQESSC